MLSQVAVRRQVKTLETGLECMLFKRHHLAVELIADGIELHQLLRSGLSETGKLCQPLKNRCKGLGVTVVATTAFALLWLQAAQENQVVASGNFRLFTLGNEC